MVLKELSKKAMRDTEIMVSFDTIPGKGRAASEQPGSQEHQAFLGTKSAILAQRRCLQGV